MEARIVNAAQAPWAVLLALNLPLGPLSGWGLRDMLKLRCVCVALRGGMTTAAFFTAIPVSYTHLTLPTKRIV